MEELEFTALIEEYKICREEASRLESHIWKASTILGLSSGAGLLLKMKSELRSADHFYLTCAIAVLMITASLVWWRLSRRWWSIQHVKYKRMNALETKLDFKQNSLVGESDIRAMSDVRSRQDKGSLFERIVKHVWNEIPTNISSHACDDIGNYEYRGNQPVLKMLVCTNILLWLCTVFAMAPKIGLLWETTAICMAYFLFALLFWRKP